MTSLATVLQNLACKDTAHDVPLTRCVASSTPRSVEELITILIKVFEGERTIFENLNSLIDLLYYSSSLPLGPLWRCFHHKQQQSSSYIHLSFPSGSPKNAGKSGIRSKDQRDHMNQVSCIRARAGLSAQMVSLQNCCVDVSQACCVQQINGCIGGRPDVR